MSEPKIEVVPTPFPTLTALAGQLPRATYRDMIRPKMKDLLTVEFERTLDEDLKRRETQLACDRQGSLTDVRYVER
jgi:hypothetical protein